jgi:hypothetical protein
MVKLGALAPVAIAGFDKHPERRRVHHGGLSCPFRSDTGGPCGSFFPKLSPVVGLLFALSIAKLRATYNLDLDTGQDRKINPEQPGS